MNKLLKYLADRDLQNQVKEAQAFNVECPFFKDEISTLQMQMFKYRILDAYSLMGANLTADFDFDIAGS